MRRASRFEALLISVVSAALVAACGGQSGEPAPSQPAPSEPAPSEPAPSEPDAPTTPEECAAAGGAFVPSIGNAPSCPDGTQSIGNIRHGIEGGICCK